MQGDGHCFIHFLRISMAILLKINITHGNLVNIISNEVHFNEATYIAYLPHSVAVFGRDAKCYFVHKQNNKINKLYLILCKQANLRLDMVYINHYNFHTKCDRYVALFSFERGHVPSQMASILKNQIIIFLRINAGTFI